MNPTERRRHDRAIELAATAIDFRLATVEREELERHLAACAPCDRVAVSLRGDAAALAVWARRLPSRRVDDAVLAAIAGHPAHPARPLRLVVLLAASILLLVALLGVAAAGSFIVRNWLQPSLVIVPSPSFGMADISPSPAVPPSAGPSRSPAPTTPASPTPAASPSPSPDASPSPAGTAAPTASSGPSPTVGPPASPAPVAWRWQQAMASSAASGSTTVGPDGTVFLAGSGAGCDLAVHSFDQAGLERAGWPYCIAGAQYIDLLAVDATGTTYVQGPYPAGIVGLRPDGTVEAGWPQAYGFLGGTLEAGIVVLTPRASDTAPLSELRAFDPEGRPLPGWPVSVPGDIVEPVAVRVGSNGTVAVLYRDPSSGHRWVTAVGPDGAVRAGWPVRVPAAMDGTSTTLETITRDGRIVLGAHEPFPDWPAPAAQAAALPSQVAVITPDGTIPDGWPVLFDRPLSTVAEGPDGTLYAVAGDVQYSYKGQTWAGGPYDVIALRADGSAAPGWPVRLPKGMTPQAAARTPAAVPWAEAPVVGDDGRVVVTTGSNDARDGIVLIGPAGTIDGTFLLPRGDRIGSGAPAAPGGPAIAPLLVGGRVFLTVSPGPAPSGTEGSLVGKDELLALDASGRPVPGWPLTVTGGGWMDVRAAPDGTLVVTVSRTDPATGNSTLLVMTADPAATGSLK